MFECSSTGIRSTERAPSAFNRPDPTPSLVERDAREGLGGAVVMGRKLLAIEASQGDRRTERVVTGAPTQCVACHNAQKPRDDVFSDYRR